MPLSGRPAVRSSSLICSSLAPSKTAVAALIGAPPFLLLCSWSAQPRWVSRIWPMFMRDGTPSGLRMMSTGVPSGRNGMSSWGRILATTPLLPWRPAILSPTLILRFAATLTRIRRLTPGSSSAPFSRSNSRDVDDLAALAVRQAQARVLNLARLLAEDRAQQSLLCRQLGLALGRDLADEDVARLDLCADVDDRRTRRGPSGTPRRRWGYRG